MLRFIDLRFQAVQHRFAWWDTVTSRFLTIANSQAWDTWAEFEADYREEVAFRGNGAFATAAAITAATEEGLARHRGLCPPWVTWEPGEDELDARDGCDGPYDAGFSDGIQYMIPDRDQVDQMEAAELAAEGE